MTIILIFGAIAGLYMLWLLFRLASYALPIYAGIATAFLLIRCEFSAHAAISAGVAAAIAMLLIGQFIFAFIRSPLLRLGIAFVFAAPAGTAGFQAAQGIGQLATSNGAALMAIGLIAGIVTGVAAWRNLILRTTSNDFDLRPNIPASVVSRNTPSTNAERNSHLR